MTCPWTGSRPVFLLDIMRVHFHVFVAKCFPFRKSNVGMDNSPCMQINSMCKGFWIAMFDGRRAWTPEYFFSNSLLSVILGSGRLTYMWETISQAKTHFSTFMIYATFYMLFLGSWKACCTPDWFGVTSGCGDGPILISAQSRPDDIPPYPEYPLVI